MRRAATRATGLWIPAAALLAAWLLSLAPATVRFELWLGDAMQRLVARDVRFNDAVVVDIDDASIDVLRPHFGSWPYHRDAHALVLDWLTEQGATSIVFDLLFADPRPGDGTLATSLKQHGNATLIASAQPHDGGSGDPGRAGQLRPFAWSVPPQLPASAWSHVSLPARGLTQDTAGRLHLAVAAVAEDADGVLRRLPLVHRIDGIALPSPALAALLKPGQAPGLTVDADQRHVRFANHRWPIDAAGTVRLALPRNRDAILTLPFRQVAEAALGVVRLEDAATFFKGKTVFIGSTAQLSDRVTTPLGTMSGTTMLALTHQSLLHDRLMAPASPLVNGLLALLAAVALAAASLMSDPRRIAFMLGGALVALFIAFAVLTGADLVVHLAFSLGTLVIGGLLLGVRNFQRLRQSRDQMERMASTDALTGLLLRRSFLERFQAEVGRAQRENSPLSIAILDLDHFKRVNDTYGHPVGDLVLKVFAQTLRDQLRGSDIAGRWGGEEFVVLLPDTPVDAAVGVLERVRLAIAEKTFPAPADNLRVTMSAGVVLFNGSITDPEAIVGMADTALYTAKESGRNCICVG
jgi:diguanylate cyclase (GGDEF)-like protein